MAKNWKVGEAVEAIRNGSTEDKLDIGRRFPLFAILAAQTNDAGASLLNCVPDYVTARKIESVLKGEAQEVGEDGGGDEDEKPAKNEKSAEKKSAAKSNDDALEGKSPKELYAICQELGIEVEPKKPASVYLKAIKKHQAAEAKKAEKAAAATKDDDWGDDEGAKDSKPASKGKSKDDDDDWDI